MPSETPSTPALRVRPILGSVWSVLRAHAVVIAGLGVALHFVAWKLAGELQADVLAYVGQTFRLDLPELAGLLASAWSDRVPDLLREIADQAGLRFDQVGALATLMAFGVFMQLAVAELMFGVSAPSPGAVPGGPSRTAPSLVAARFRGAEFLFDMARSIGILLVIYATIVICAVGLGLALFVFELEYFHFVHSVPVIEALFTLVAALTFAASLAVISLRWFVAVPTTIVENTSVRESLKRSWRATAPCWKTIVALNLLLQLPFEVAMPVLDALTGLPDDSPARSFAEWGLLGIGRTIVFATLSCVCYAHLQKTGSEPAPAPPA